MSYGTRIKFNKQDHLLVSNKIYSTEDGSKMVRLIIDTDAMEYWLVDPITAFKLRVGGEGITNFEVLQRNAKKALKAYLGIKFEKEVRNRVSDNSDRS
jgi:hypothetical protein